MEYEYKIELFWDKNYEDLDIFLNNMGGEGWKLVNVLHISTSEDEYDEYIFIRKIDNNR